MNIKTKLCALVTGINILSTEQDVCMGAVVLIDSISKVEVCLYEKHLKIRCT